MRPRRIPFVGTSGLALLLVGGAVVLGAVAGTDGVGHPDMSPAPGQVWCPEHVTWHEGKTQRFDPLRIGPVAPPGKVWNPEHGHFHDL